MIFLGNLRFLLRVQPFAYVCKLSTITSNNMPIKTFVFFDLETTGLPHLEHNQTKITELSAVAVQADHIELGCFPRVHNKLSFCFNPRKMISPEVTSVTGLSNDMLEHQTYFSNDVVNIIKTWLNMNQKPVCLVAHNGSRFDYPIFRAEVEKTGNSFPEDLLCVDSLTAFKHIDKHNSLKEETNVTKSVKEVPFEFDDGYDEILCQIAEEVEREEERKLTPEERQKMNETTPKKQIISSQAGSKSKIGVVASSRVSNSLSYKLGELYTRLTSKEPINCHEAEGDVVMLITCAAVYGEKFVEYANEHAVSFNSIPAMKLGKKIGF